MIAGLATGETVAVLRRAQRKAIAFALAGALVAIGAVFFLLAGFVQVARHVGIVEAALWFGAGFVVVGLVIILVHKVSERLRRETFRRQRNRDFTKAAIAAGIALAPALLRGRLGAVALVAPAVAAVAYAIYRENAGGPDGSEPGDRL